MLPGNRHTPSHFHTLAHKARYAVTLAFVIRFGKVGCAAPYMPGLVREAAGPIMFSHRGRWDQCLYIIYSTFRAVLKRDYGVA